MKRYLHLAIALFYLSCTSIACDFNAPGENIYKHFMGTIGDRHIVLDLRYGYCGASNFGGSYFYEPGSNVIQRIVIHQPSSSDHNTTLSAEEYSLEDDWNEVSARQLARPYWTFNMYGNKLTGKWTSPDGKTLDINLTETTENIVPLDMLCYTDKVENSVVKAHMRYNFVGIRPTIKNNGINAMFINNSLLELANTTNLQTDNWLDFPQKQGKEMMTEYENGMTALGADTSRHDPSSNYSGFTLVFPLYNENGFLTIEYEYVKNLPLGNTKLENRYCNTDVKTMRSWKRNDMLIADDAAITKLLQDEFARKVDAKSERYSIKDKIAATENIAVMCDGLLFCPLIGNGRRNEEEIRIFIPYSQLKGMLTKDFASRIAM